MSDWLSRQGINWDVLGLDFVKSLGYILLVFVVARISYALIIYLLKRVLVQRKGKILINEKKANTLFPLLKNITFYLIAFTVTLSILEKVFVIETGTILASASVVGVALGFGAQSFIKDIIGGFFILFEDQFAVGEYIKAGQFSGNVEEIGLRATRLRDWSGELHIIPNGSITAVTNYNRGKMRALVDINIPYEEDLDRAMEVMHKVCEEVTSEYKDTIIDKPTVQGVIQFGERNVVLRVVAYTKPNEQWELEREIRKRIYKAFSDKEIRIPQSYTIKLDENI